MYPEASSYPPQRASPRGDADTRKPVTGPSAGTRSRIPREPHPLARAASLGGCCIPGRWGLHPEKPNPGGAASRGSISRGAKARGAKARGAAAAPRSPVPHPPAGTPPERAVRGRAGPGSTGCDVTPPREGNHTSSGSAPGGTRGRPRSAGESKILIVIVIAVIVIVIAINSNVIATMVM